MIVFIAICSSSRRVHELVGTNPFVEFLRMFFFYSFEGRPRLFSAFFRVGFYGSVFGRLDTCEFIYKKPPFTKLAEVTADLRVTTLCCFITSSIKEFYEDKLGIDTIELFRDSNEIDKSALDPQKVMRIAF